MIKYSSALGLIFGSALGLIAGLLIDGNLAIATSIGAGVGLVIGMIVSLFAKKK